MKKLIITVVVLLGMVTSAWASSYTGDISGSTLIAHPDWADASLSWIVDDERNPGSWTYEYTWSTGIKDISHLGIEVSSTFTSEDLISWDPDETAIDGGVQGPQEFSYPAGSIFGLKWDLDEDTTSFHLTLVSTRMPMWGDFYAKDGNGGTVNARNLNFGTDTDDPIDDGNNGGWVLVPDTVVPIPSAIWLLGSAFIGLVGFRRKCRG